MASTGPSPATGASRSPRRKSIRSRTPCRAAFRRATARPPLADIDRDEMRPGLSMRRRNRQAARAGADVDATRRLELARDGQVLGDDELGFGPRDQDIGRNFKGQREEFLPAHEIRHRRAGGTLDYELAKALSRRLVDLVVEMRIQLDSLAVQDMSQHDFRVQTGALGSPALQVIGGPA